MAGLLFPGAALAGTATVKDDHDPRSGVNLPDVLAVRQMGRSNVASRNDREQVAESIRLKLATLRRRRTLRGSSGLVRPALSLVTPVRVKRELRRARGQAL